MKVLWGRMKTTRHEIRCRVGVVPGGTGVTLEISMSEIVLKNKRQI